MASHRSDRLLLGRVALRNEYDVEKVPDGYEVTSRNAQGASHGQFVAAELVAFARRYFAGRKISVEDATKALATSGLMLPYRGGYKLQFFAQSVLVVLVAVGHASHEKAGRAFHYQIESRVK